MARELLGWIVGGILLSAVLFLGVRHLANMAVTSYLSDSTVTERQEKAIAKSLQSYIDANRLRFSDIDLLRDWANQNEEWVITLYRDNAAIFSSYTQMQVQILSDEEVNTEPGAYIMQFADGTARMYGYDFSNRYYNRAQLLAAAVASFGFIGVLLAFIRRKLRIIARLESELKIMGGGDLSIPITIVGNDELTSLAEEIDAMRRSVVARQESERAAIAANRDLVTAMSHDLRTPLTSLIGYLEIMRRSPNAESSSLSIVEAAIGKAEHMKQLTDRLFSLFVVPEPETEWMQWTQMETQEFVVQFVDGSRQELETNGWTVEQHGEAGEGTMRIDPHAMQRVFDNLQSNLEKYADRNAPVSFTVLREEGELRLQICNHKAAAPHEQSNGIGLSSCAAILAQHGGSFEKEDNEIFTAVLHLPVVA